MNSKIKKDVLSIISEIANTVQWNKYVNEHYLHHYFTYHLQKKGYKIDLTKDRQDYIVHPEWPTYRKEDEEEDIHIQYRRYYKKEIANGNLSENAKGGHFDFAIGEYNEPDIGIEFIWEYGWNGKEFEFDFLKCMDGGLPFTTTISYSVIVREKVVSKNGRKINFENSMNNAYKNAKEHLVDHNNLYKESRRDLFLIITEIGRKSKRHWRYNKSHDKFIEETHLSL